MKLRERDNVYGAVKFGTMEAIIQNLPICNVTVFFFNFLQIREIRL